MIDIHTHILPGIDDGSKSVEETIQMLEVMEKDGVDTVVATPHYYHDVSIEEFIAKRNSAHEVVQKIKNKPEIKLGAEVWLEYGMHENPGLKKLCIEGTDYMLIELPYVKWDSWIYDELFKISLKGINIIIAHIDRYTHMIEEADMIKLIEMGFKLQGNVDKLGGFLRKSSVEKLMKKGIIYCIGSDCHNMTNRKPCMKEAVERITKLAGKEFVDKLMRKSEKILKS